MWDIIPKKDKEEYKKLILAFASLTEMFCQKSIDDNTIPSPIINSKFQETVFQKALKANAEDIGNTSYDASLRIRHENKEYKFLIGIKTFGIGSGDQKIAQFKAVQPYFFKTIERIEEKSKLLGNISKKDLDSCIEKYHLDIAKRISCIRNERIDSSIENLKGFRIRNDNDENVQSVYHVLMPSSKGDEPKIYVGETSYDKIDIDNIEILGSTNRNNPTNFLFTDKKHIYKYTSSDSQLYMKFNNKDIVVDQWDVIYAQDAYEIFSDIATKVYSAPIKTRLEKNRNIVESYSWSLLNSRKEVERYSGFNSFYGVGSKLAKEQREKRCENLLNKYSNDIPLEYLKEIIDSLNEFLIKESPTIQLKREKENLRCEIRNLVKKTGDKSLEKDVCKLLYRPVNEMYIAIPNAKRFHMEHPNFFCNKIGTMKYDKSTGKEKFELKKSKEEKAFNLIFEPSGDCVPCYITQGNGKGIESAEKQSYLGKWILRDLFQLEEYQPLTKRKLDELGINGIRLYKEQGSPDVHLQFIWIDDDDLPNDYIE